MDELESVIERHVRKRSVGEFTLPGLLKIKAAKRPATKKRMGRNPATGEEIVIPPKPATTRVRVTALKKLGHDPLATDCMHRLDSSFGLLRHSSPYFLTAVISAVIAPLHCV